MFIGTPITDDLANRVIAQILFPESEDPDKDIQLYINMPGGSMTAGLAIYDTMQYAKPPISTKEKEHFCKSLRFQDLE